MSKKPLLLTDKNFVELFAIKHKNGVYAFSIKDVARLQRIAGTSKQFVVEEMTVRTHDEPSNKQLLDGVIASAKDKLQTQEAS